MNIVICGRQDEWTGDQKLQYGDVPEDIEPEEIRPMGNYAVSITWPDGFSQVPPLSHTIFLLKTVFLMPCYAI